MAASNRGAARGAIGPGAYGRREPAVEGLESVGTGLKLRRTSSGVAAATQNLAGVPLRNWGVAAGVVGPLPLCLPRKQAQCTASETKTCF